MFTASTQRKRSVPTSTMAETVRYHRSVLRPAAPLRRVRPTYFRSGRLSKGVTRVRRPIAPSVRVTHPPYTARSSDNSGLAAFLAVAALAIIAAAVVATVATAIFWPVALALLAVTVLVGLRAGFSNRGSSASAEKSADQAGIEMADLSTSATNHPDLGETVGFTPARTAAQTAAQTAVRSEPTHPTSSARLGSPTH